jgi:hypothetical protein
MYRINGPSCVQEISLRLPPATLEDVVVQATVLQELARLKYNTLECIGLRGPRRVQEISLRLPPATLEDVVGRAAVLQELERLEFNALKFIDLTGVPAVCRRSA